uniref:Uncharacterized protein n=1 Tax=Utricularia reniformis TaxID=192314 RepID=A0A1Y0AZH3_9LAMI|nr:hypothetical protein AEK19_MT0299 [Utricularia reniformis]ART30575.1 hypothetical protein AEK19_MT0299 [Utricularia reniformis]
MSITSQHELDYLLVLTLLSLYLLYCLFLSVSLFLAETSSLLACSMSYLGCNPTELLPAWIKPLSRYLELGCSSGSS